MDPNKIRFVRNFEEERSTNWTAITICAVLIVLSAIPFGMLADWLRPIDWFPAIFR